MSYQSDLEKWRRHFRLMAEGKLKPDRNGKYTVGTIQRGEGSNLEARIKMITPLEAALERVRSEMKRKKRKRGNDRMKGSRMKKFIRRDRQASD